MGETADYLNDMEEAGEFDGEFFSHADTASDDECGEDDDANDCEGPFCVKGANGVVDCSQCPLCKEDFDDDA